MDYCCVSGGGSVIDKSGLSVVVFEKVSDCR